MTDLNPNFCICWWLYR